MAVQRREDRDPERYDARNGVPWVWITLIVLLLFGAGLALWWWLTDDADQTGVLPEESGAADIGVTLSEISDLTEEFVGETVIVSGEVNEIVLLEPAAFTIGGDEFIGGDEVLVVSAAPITLPEGLERDDALVENDLVQVEGTVAVFDPVDIEEELGVDLDDELLDDYEGEPVIVADQVDVAGRVPLEGDQLAAEEPFFVGNDPRLVENFGLFVEHPVLVRAEVAEVIGPAAFVTEAGLLVVGAEPIEALAEGSGVFARGTARNFALVEVEEALGVDLDDALFEEFAGEPAVVADTTVVLADIGEIRDDPEAFTGGQPTVLGEINNVLAANAVLIGDDDLLVIDVNAAANPIEEASLLATGEVVTFDLVEIEEEFGVDLDDEILGNFNGEPALLATDVEVIR